MLLYILLILGQAFASQKQADQIYNCVHNFAKREAYVQSSGNYTVREVVEACSDDVGAGIQIKEAKIIDSSTHYIKLTWLEKGKEVFRHYAFNIPNTKLCNSNESSQIKSLSVSLREIFNKSENSRGYNTCIDVSEQGNIGVRLKKYGFGFKRTSKEGPCIRACDASKNEILQGTKTNLIHKFYVSKNTEVLNDRVMNPALGDVFIDLKCVKCPVNDLSYTKTHPLHNKCYNSDGCEDGYELVENPDKFDYMLVASISNPNKKCAPKCDYGEARDKYGACGSSFDKTCEDAKRFANNPQKWLSSFLAHPSAVGKCDMSKIKKMAQAYISSVEIHLMKAIEYGCNKNTSKGVLRLVPHTANFGSFLRLDYPDLEKCVNSSKDNNAQFDPTLYDLMTVNPITLESKLYTYE